MEDEAVSLAIQGNNLYVAGNFKSPRLYFSSTDFLVNENNFDSFFATYDLDGNFIGAVKIFSGNNVERIKDMIYTPITNNLIFAAFFKNEIKYTDISGPVTVNASSSKDLLIVRSDLSGIIQDTARYTTSVQNSVLKDVNLSSDNGYYLSGDLFGTIYFTSNDSIKGNTDYNSDALVIKVDNNLNFLWARKGGGIGYDHANNAISDRFGNVYLTGKVESTVTFDSTAFSQSHLINSFGGPDLFLAKYNKLGTLQWISRKGDAGDDDGSGLIQQENLVQFCGNISGSVIFNTDTLKSTGLTDVNTGFAIYDIKGNEIGAQGIGGTGLDRGSTITFHPNRNTIIAGTHRLTYFNHWRLYLFKSFRNIQRIHCQLLLSNECRIYCYQ